MITSLARIRSGQPGVPQGKVTKLSWSTSKVFPGTTRDWWIYVPAQYDARTPACVMVFQDGSGYVSETGAQRLPIVFDNLINKKEMPVTIGIFINPGTKPAATEGGRPVSNRSFEYDTLSDQYARFLIEEILPEVSSNTYRITDDPEGHALCGLSSGAICAFTVAWERPDVFRKVLSQIGSFTSIAYRPAHEGQPMQPGGDLYPTLIRKTKTPSSRSGSSSRMAPTTWTTIMGVVFGQSADGRRAEVFRLRLQNRMGPRHPQPQPRRRDHA